MSLPSHVRVIAGLLGGYVALFQVGPALADLATAPIPAAGRLIAGAPFLAVLAWVAVWPDHADRTLKESFGLDLSDASVLTGVVIHLVFAFLVFGGTLIQTAQGLSQLLATGEHPANAVPLSDQQIVTNLVLNLVLFVLAAVTWLVLVTKVRGREILAELRLQLRKIPRGIVAGVLMTIAGIVVLAMFSYALQQAGIAPENPQADAIANALTPATAILVAALAGLGEEVYFRGFLLPRLGNLSQAVLFGALHATYLTPFQVILPFALGLAFGWLVRKTSLWAAIVSHTTFNAVMLLGSIYAEELATLASQLPVPL